MGTFFFESGAIFSFLSFLSHVSAALQFLPRKSLKYLVQCEMPYLILTLHCQISRV